MARKTLTHKQEVFVEAFKETGNATQAAIVAYPDTNYPTQRSIGSENLTKPNIIDAIREGTEGGLVAKAFENLLTARRLDYFVFGKHMSDEEIKGHVEAQGLTCLNIRQTEKGKMAFFTQPDTNANAKGVELALKVTGGFAPDKHININIKAQPSDRIKELAKKLNA